MNTKLTDALNGRVPLTIMLEDNPGPDKSLTISILCRPVTANIELHEYGSLETTAFLLSKEQALNLAVSLTEAVARFD